MDEMPCERVGDFDGDGAADRVSLVGVSPSGSDICVEWAHGGAERVNDRRAHDRELEDWNFSWLEAWEVASLRGGAYESVDWDFEVEAPEALGDGLILQVDAEPVVLYVTPDGWFLTMPDYGADPRDGFVYPDVDASSITP